MNIWDQVRRYIKVPSNFVISFTISFLVVFAVSANPNSKPAQLSVTFLQSPIPMFAQDKYYLVYELYLTNYQPAPITLTQLTVNGVKENSKQFTFEKTELAALIHPIGIKKSEKEPLIIQPGQAKMIFMWLPFTDKTAIPNQLIHQISFTTVDPQNKNSIENLSLFSLPMPVQKRELTKIRSPLRGGPWIAANGPSNSSAHRVANIIIHGQDYFSQRYAIDFIQIGKNGKTFSGKENLNASYYCYNKDVYSVHEGKVVAVKDGIPENIPHSGKTAVPINVETVGGNYIIVDIGSGQYAFYAHLIPGSLKVKVGDRVAQGQAIAKLGNTGNSSEPHLHFHICNGPSPLGSNGMPYVFDKFSVLEGKATSDKAGYDVEISDKPAEQKNNQLVLEDTIIDFGREDLATENSLKKP